MGGKWHCGRNNEQRAACLTVKSTKHQWTSCQRDNQRGVDRGGPSVARGVRCGLIKLRHLHGNISNIPAPPEAPTAPTRKRKERFLFAATDSCSLAQAFSWDAFKNTRWPWEQDEWCDESDAKGHFSTVMFSQSSSSGMDSRKGGFFLKRKRKKKKKKETKTTSLANVGIFHRPRVSTKCWESNTSPQSVPQTQLLPSHFVTTWIPKPVKRR